MDLGVLLIGEHSSKETADVAGEGAGAWPWTAAWVQSSLNWARPWGRPRAGAGDTAASRRGCRSVGTEEGRDGSYGGEVGNWA